MSGPSTVTSPIKGLSVREDTSGARALHTKVAKDRYKCISNFYFDLKAFVKFPSVDHAKYNGFIVDVFRIDGAAMECYMTIDEMENVRKFKAAINRSFSAKGGVLAHGINDSQLSSYIMNKMQEFSLRGGREIIGSLVIGRQPNPRSVDDRGVFVDESDPTAVERKVDDPDTAVYIFNSNLQMNKDGVIPEKFWQHRYMAPFLRAMPAAMADKVIRNLLQGYEVNVELPLQDFNWEVFIGRARIFFKMNFLPFILLLSGGLAIFHYEKILSCIGSCPVPTAIGHPSSGKSTALKLVAKLAGMHIVSQSSGEFVVSGLVKTTIPLCWDDPAIPSMVRQPLVSVFDGLGSQTQVRGNEKPLTSFLLTVNFKLDDDMRSFERTTPIFFNTLTTSEGELVEEYLEKKSEIFSLATTHSLRQIIALSETLTRNNLTKHIQFFRDRLHGLPPRLADIYSIYRHFAYEVIKLVDNPRVIEGSMVDEFFENGFLPYVQSLYDTTVKVHTSIDDVLQLLIRAIQAGNYNKNELKQWMRPSMVTKKNKINSLVFILPKALSIIKESHTQYPTERNVRDLVEQAGGNNSFKSLFAGLPKKVSCVSVPRHSINKDTLEAIDNLIEGNEPTAETEQQQQQRDLQNCENCEALQKELRLYAETSTKQLKETEERYEEELRQMRNALVSRSEEHEKLKKELTNKVNTYKRKLEESLEATEQYKKALSKNTIEKAPVSVVVASFSGDQDEGGSHQANLDDSGLGYTSLVDFEEADETKEKEICSICRKAKAASMIVCTKCNQWLHCRCLGLPYKDAKKMASSFVCKECK